MGEVQLLVEERLDHPYFDADGGACAGVDGGGVLGGRALELKDPLVVGVRLILDYPHDQETLNLILFSVYLEFVSPEGLMKQLK